ncbi:ABC transporter ATP-binding protein [Treponema pedis]|uniref:ABC transporter ATP-binding protein n=1 Tax=Treponema pedis TaxID=409322 RepID=A0A7S6WP79_9SPIR|nr:ABC transporter ATP-binding protein [Treponema pedis]QOW60776.1 ABC transporter ATP-binding protein [Treponema pedis]QSI04181.1 ABC transporter ATP-binding protein [Treponema pedis]
MNAIEIKDLHFAAATKEILKSVSLSVPHKQTVGLIGPNGSGKTTLLKHLYRAIEPEKNTVFINGEKIENFSYRETAKQITVMKQEQTSDFEYKVIEMVLMGRSPYRKFYESDTAEDKEIAYNALKFLGMEEAAERNFSTLSGGEKQRVLIARSLAQEADILILDEPTNHLDVHYQWALMDIIKKLHKTVLSVFHELNLAANFCDFIFVLADGKIAARGTPQEIYTPELLAKVFRIEADIMKTANGIPYIIYKRAI